MKSSTKTKGKRFEYQPTSKDDLRRRAERKGGGQFDSIFRQGIDTWRPHDGQNVIRILPPTWADHNHYGYDIWVHAFIGPDKSTYLCPSKMLSKPCPICDAAREAQRAGEEDEFKALRAKTQVVVWMLDRDGDNPAVPALYAMSFTMDKDIVTQCQNPKTGRVLLIDHPDEGYDVMFNRTGKGLNTRYVGISIDREASPILDDEAEQEELLEYIQENPIPDLLNFYSEDHLRAVIEGSAGEKDEELDEEEEDEPRAGRSERVGRRSRRDEPEDEDEAPRGRGAPRTRRNRAADEEEEEPPRRRTAARTRAREEEPEDEEDPPFDEDEVEEPDEDDVEEEKAPPSRRGGARTTSRSARDAEPDEDEDEEDVDPDEDEDEEEEEAKPAPRKSARAASRRPGRR